MNLSNLFEAQKALDERIIEEKGLQGQNLIPKKVLALITELGECANEWRGFKFWSEDRKPRTKEICPLCKGRKEIEIWIYEGVDSYDLEVFCPLCDGTESDKNPLLEEYVDSLHFALSLVIETHGGQKLPVHIPASRRLGERIENYFIDIAHSATAILRGNKTANIMAAYETLGSILGLGQALGFTEQQIEAAYFAKNKTNHKRQATGY